MNRDWRLSDPANIFPPGPLWKYLSLAPGQSPSWQEKLQHLIDGRAFCANPRWFNDPFDCLPQVASPEDPRDFEQGYEHLVRTMTTHLSSDEYGDVEKAMRSGKIGLTPTELAALSKLSWERTAQMMGVFCLSSRIDSVLMWSHYASNHTGIALRFDMRVEPRSGLMPLWKVQYSATRPIVSYVPSAQTVGFADALATKASFWEYEQEWRHFSVGGAGTYTSFDRNVITGIVFGANCEARSRDEIISMLDQIDIDKFQITPSPETFDIQLKNIG